MCPQLLAFLTGILLLSITSAQARHFKDSYGDGAASGPWGVPVSTYHRLMSSPNATSVYTVPGPNTSAPYPASGAANGWSLAVSVTADIRMSESDSGTAQEYPNKTFTGSRVVLQAPAEPIHESWSVCVLQWEIDPLNYPPKLRADDGSCSSFLSKQCIRDVEARSAAKYNPAANRCACPALSEISSCGGEQGKILMAGGACQARLFNATSIRDWPDRKLDVRRYGGPPHGRGNRTAYDQTGSVAWPVLVLWGPSNHALANGTGLEVVDPGARLACVRAKDAVQGSITPGEVGGGGASDGSSGGRVSVGGLFLWVLLGAGWLVFC